MNKNAFVCVLLSFLASTLIDGAPQGNGVDTFSEVFKSCSDLEAEGYEGYSCVSQSSCQEGYIVSNAINGQIALKQEESNLHNEELEVSNLECRDEKEQSIVRQDYDEYGDYNDYSDQSENKLICCRDPKFYGKGIFHIICFHYFTSTRIHKSTEMKSQSCNFTV